MRSLSILTLSLVGVASCAVDTATEPTAARCTAALKSTQGMAHQGLQAQGLQAQGMQSQGMQSQGMQSQGMQSQGMQAQGLQIQGMNINGLQAQGVQVQGVQVAGAIDPAALSGIALTGVSEADAASWVAGTGGTILPQNLVFLEYADGLLGATTAGGAKLEAAALAGLLLPFMTTDGHVLWITIGAVAPHPSAPDLLLYSLELGGENLCGENGGGMFVPGIWDEAGKRHDSIATGSSSVDTTFACTAGVITKCVVWGYRPWTEGSTIHEACTRMARADYCGDGVPHTEEGTEIDLYDTRGIQTEVPNDGMTFEAGWGPGGAVCVREPRYVDRTTEGEIVYPSCWAELPRCEQWAEATALGAELGNNSHHLDRVLDCGS